MSIVKLVRQIYSQRGLAGFYAGFRINLMRILPNTAIMFMCYEYLTRYITARLDTKNK
jgi:hypothetical protein